MPPLDLPGLDPLPRRPWVEVVVELIVGASLVGLLVLLVTVRPA